MAKKIVRILRQLPVEGVLYQPDQLVSFEEKEAAQYVAAGAADDSKESVAYCKGKGVDVVPHKSAEALEKAAKAAAAKAAESGDGVTGD